MKKKLSLMMICFLGLVSFVFAAAFEPTNATETIYLTQENINAQDYLSVSKEQWSNEKTYDGVTGKYFNMSSTDRLLNITVKGVSKFEVFVQNTNANRDYYITVGNESAKTITHTGNKIESSGEIETGTTDEITISLGGAGSSVYPVKIVLTKAENSSEPSLSVSPKTLEFTLTPSKTKAEESFTLTGKNLKDGTYNLTIPNLAGLTVAPTSFTVADGAVEQQFTVTYESTANIAKATTDITATVGDLSASVAVTYQSRATANTQSTVKEAATWDWSQLTETVQLTAETTPKQTEEFLLADLDDRITFTEGFGDATAIVMKDMQYPSRGGYAQGNIIKFKTSVAGTIDVDFSNTGGSRPYRHLYVNGKPTTFKSGDNTKVSATGIEVAAGEIELKGYIPDAKDPVARDGDVVGDAMLRWYKITFTPKAEGGEEPSGETTYPITATWDFQNLNPAALADVNIQGNNEADVASDVDGISMHVISAGGKLQYNASGYAQFNTNTTIQVPVGSTKDIVTVVSYPGQSKYTVGDEDATGQNTFSHTATVAEVTQGYVEITPTATSYIYSIKVVMNEPEEGDEPVATDVTATWDFSNENVMAEAVALSASSGTVKAVEDNGILLTVEANNATFRNNGNNIQVREGAVFKVPVKNAGDEVIVKGYPNYSSYTVGNITVESLNGNGATSDATYKAKASDATQGYVTITSNNNNNYFYSIKVIQYAPKEAETLDNQAVTATFPFDSGAAGQKATFSGDYFLNSKVVAGDNMGYYGVRTIDSKAFTGIQPKADTKEAAGEGDYMTFIIQPKPGFIFTPTKVSLNASKYGTGNGTIDVLWQNTDGTTVTLDEGKGVARNNETPAYSSFEYQDLSKATPGEGACGVRVNIYGKLAANKQLCLRDIVIEGTLSGTEKEVPILESFKINNTEYQIEDVFGEDYEATLKLSKSEKMVNENNPLTDVTATSGEIGAITYTESTETGCKVTIPVAAGETTMNYILNIIQKPDYTLSYIDVDGNTVLDTQVLEEDSKIGEFKVNIADVKAATEGYKARGWFKLYSVGEKYTTEEIVTSDLNLYAVETEIEVSSDSRKYEFDLKDKNFYAEDHEAFNVTSEKAKWHDNTHGWAFYNGDKIDLLVGAKATISIAVCKYGAATNILVKDAQGNTLETLDGMNADSDGALVAYNYEGEPGTLTLEMVASGEMYIHSVKIVNTNVTNYTSEGNWYFVKPGDASSLIDVIDVVNGQNAATDAPRSYIYLPNGTYDLKETVLTTIGGHNISLIGESQEGVIIKNAPHYTKESINNTATLKNTGTGNYFQDLTIQNALDYYGAQAAGLDGGRAVALWDTGTKTICKNVKMLSYQDTYYTNNANGEYYWETSDIHGTVDFICGEGTLFMENSTLTLEKRKADGSGENTLTAPSTGADKTIGYVFNNCTIDNTCGSSYNLGRAWNNAPRCAYINTTMTNAEKLSANRWTLKGMNTEPAKAFVEYNTKDANNVVISPKSHIVTFTASKSDKTNPDFETILTDEQAAEFTVEKVFGEWKPADAAKQIETPEAELKDGTISWTNVEGNAGYALYADDELLTITDKDATSYIIETANESAANRAESTVEYTIRAINTMGGLGNVKTVSVITGINKINADIIDGNAVVYDLQGRRVNNATKGVFIVNGKKVIVK
ncbi:MAG: hypothetical protein IJ069_04235 [Prevotella sp.]|nr:hypothetical protein [Prevotella sp.]